MDEGQGCLFTDCPRDWSKKNKIKIMKNLVYLILLIPIMLTAQIPNAGFEDWSISSTGIEEPDGWKNLTFAPGVLVKTTDQYEGDFALGISNGTFLSSAACYTTFPTEANYHKLTGFLKVDSIASAGRAFISVRAWTGSTSLIIGEFQHTEVSIDYFPFEIEFDLPTEPIDSMRIFVQSGPIPIPNGISAGYSNFKLDNLKLISTTNPITNIESTHLIDVFPNPIANTFQVESKIQGFQKIQLFELSGKKVLEKEIDNSNNEAVSIAHLQNGIYIILIETQNHQLFRQKIVKVDTTY